eukprot:CAMPEP_0180534600 /NCGR_PEP_ID=MMETSP1036_2-20121128/64268_1 /TAXON_ID=632150 /ORGANISM="Azadinium spinosum, Strain 3D9" /LENGTH=92 /DNA_ID=CAMNT_0022548937 /DNA_START=403 /DNA_END=678 /DNA_ORIENTATION=-
MEVVLATTDPADAATLTMEDLLRNSLIIPEVAFCAEVLPKVLAARPAALPGRLPGETALADHLPNQGPVHGVNPATGAIRLIVAMAAPEGLP